MVYVLAKNHESCVDYALINMEKSKSGDGVIEWATFVHLVEMIYRVHKRVKGKNT